MLKIKNMTNRVAFAATALIVSAQIASAQDLGARATVWRTYLANVLNLLPVAAAIAGFGLLITAGAGLLLVLLLAGIALLVTRQVVVPVRAASRTAVRLADGNLSERTTCWRVLTHPLKLIKSDPCFDSQERLVEVVSLCSLYSSKH